MTFYRDEAERIYRSTSEHDSNRGVIAALLHIADLLGGTGGQAPSPAVDSWKGAALQYLQDGYQRSKSAERITIWLATQGHEVDLADVTAAMWEFQAAGRVEADTSDKNDVKFSAAR
ncbi:hypothetical protein [Streptomyces sp. IB2014 016-6]|uniref:hypothetical protein n=1 Tax=Streptomyces sp. IB2014 016-6 TaxID=2517818 RepID=UPI0011CB9F83|nr:hypothetical protein [Streptomyces sp. IB2014 016-6]TXL91610.1 hypothetical protein EW053_04595 [Streptomyces sp. IB2014 016-6]